MLYDWNHRRIPDSPTSFDPFRIVKCPCCGHRGKPALTTEYRVFLFLLLAACAPIIWVLPWSWLSTSALRNTVVCKESMLLVELAGVSALLLSRNGWRCGRCRGILW